MRNVGERGAHMCDMPFGDHVSVQEPRGVTQETARVIQLRRIQLQLFSYAGYSSVYSVMQTTAPVIELCRIQLHLFSYAGNSSSYLVMQVTAPLI